MIKHRQITGFTLIEVLIAMSLLSVMVLLLFASLKIGAESWGQGEEKVSKVNDIAVVYNFFQSYLSSAQPQFSDGKNDEHSLLFQGGDQHLQFVSSFPASAGRAGLQLFNVFLAQTEQGPYIKVSVTPFDPAKDGVSADNEEAVDLFGPIESFNLQYWPIGTEGGDWEDEWLNKEVMPRLVKIKIIPENDMYWPDMVIELKVTGKPGDDNDELDTDRDEQQSGVATP
ncbi:MAG: prepilin-type N-terminal cleavage/methylation domain-containing protein [Methylococcaceae bacterium]|jgi:general secretion pathway protein J